MGDKMNKTIHFTVIGRVQGVFFRASTKAQAEQLNITGWVRNLSDGNVEGMASGEVKQLDRFQEWLKQGPKMATVSQLTVKDVAEQTFPGFTIR